MHKPQIIRVTVRVAGRIAQALFTVWCAATVSFFALGLVPGDPVDARFGPLASLSDAQRAALRQQFGLDAPLWMQYFDSLGKMALGDFGYSFQQHLPVLQVIGRQLQPTLQLTVVALAFTVAFVLLGQFISRARTAWAGAHLRARAVEFFQLVAVSVPNYWVGFTLLIVFSYTLGWVPAGSNHGPSAAVLPALAIAIPLAGLIGRVLDTELDAVEHTAFALSSRARGMGRWRFSTDHGLRHAAPPLAGLLTTLIGGILGGAVLIENVFARPGIGQVVLNAVLHRDMPVVIGCVVLSAMVFSALGALADALVWWADPRPETRAAR
jgi:peptide/nickel transport system permease protein